MLFATPLRRCRLAASVSVLALAATACGGGSSGNDQAACGPYYEINAALSGAGDPSSVPALLDELETVVPADIEASLTLMISTERDVFSGGDESALETPEFFEAATAAESWMFDNCEFVNRVEVDAVDFSYVGLDSEYPSGSTAFLVTNAGTEAHELMLLRRNDGVSESWDEILELPQGEAMAMATPMGSAWVGQPTAQQTLVVDLVPGDYVAVCFVAEGTTVDFDGNFTEGTGQPHFMLGMRADFSVV